MLYRILTYILPPFGFRAYYRRIFYSKLNKVPLNKPLILVGNHPNSFSDGMLIGAYLTQHIYFLMRADMFMNAFASWCLKELHVAPVYRVQEGLENVHKNKDTFEGIYDLLRMNRNLVVFAEGISTQKRRLLSLKKGTGRMAFGAEEKYDLDVYVVPVGLNYTNPAKFRAELMISFNDPIRIKDFKEDYKENSAKALLNLNRKIEAALKEEVILINDPKNDRLVETLLSMERNNLSHPVFKWMYKSDDRRKKEKALSDRINKLSELSVEDLESLRKKVFTYTESLKKAALRDKPFGLKLDFGFFRYLAVILLFPLYLISFISNILPFTVPRLLANNVVKSPVFYSSAYVSFGLILYLIYLPVLMIIAVVYLGWIGLVTGLLVPILGYYALIYQEVARERLQAFGKLVKSLTNKALVEDIKTQRKQIFELINSVELP